MADRRAFPQKKRVEIFTRQDGRCSICGEKLQPGMWHIDHIAALCHDGTNDDDNLRAICIGCHKDKTRRDVQERSRADRMAVGGKQRKGPPMAGSRDSGWKKMMDGRVVRR